MTTVPAATTQRVAVTGLRSTPGVICRRWPSLIEVGFRE